MHSINEDGTSYGRGIATSPYAGMQHAELVGYDDWGYSDDTAFDGDMSYTEAHPNWGEKAPRGSARDYPSWGKGGDPLPEGTAIRARKRGMAWKEQMPLQIPEGVTGFGWQNKTHLDTPLNSDQSDESQLYIMTSQTQRDRVRDNNRAVARGTDDPRAEIPTRMRGMRTKTWSGGERHDDMLPKTQDGPRRPFVYREAQTGPANYQEWVRVNEMYVSEPIQRSLPADVPLGGYETDATEPESIEETDFYYG